MIASTVNYYRKLRSDSYFSATMDTGSQGTWLFPLSNSKNYLKV